MGGHCVAYGCSNNGVKKEKNSAENITFHRFPKDDKLNEKWVNAVRRKNWQPSKHSILCSQHFKEEDIDRTSLLCVRLRENVIPSIFSEYPAYLQSRQQTKRRKIKRQGVPKLSEENKEKKSMEKNPSYNAANKNKLSKVEMDERVLQIHNALKNIEIELDNISCNDLDTGRSEKLKSDVLAIIFSYLSEVGTYFDYQDANYSHIDEVNHPPIEYDCDEPIKSLILITDNNLEGDNCRKLLESYAESQNLDGEESTSDTTVQLIHEIHNYISKGVNVTKKTQKKVVRHTCPDCDLSLSSAYLLSKHPPLCIARYSKDNSLSYWGRKECPKCNVIFKTIAHLKRHLIVHKIQDYETLLSTGTFNKESTADGSTLVPTENINSDDEGSTAVKQIEDILSEKEEAELVMNGIDNVVFNEIFDSPEPDSEFHVNFIVKSVIRPTPDSKLPDEGKENNVCEFCDETFDSVNELNQHKESNHPGGGHPYVCNHCPLKFQRLFTLNDHVREHHKNVSTADGRNKYLKRDMRGICKYFLKSIYFNAFECSHCERVFISAKDLETHHLKLLKEKRTKCDTNDGFEQQKKHNYTCKICGDESSSYTEYKSHNYLYHNNETPARCPECLRLFKNEYYKRKHLRNMHSETSVCEVCGAVYNCQHSFNRHMLGHCNIRKYKCDLCPKTFKEQFEVASHRTIHMREKRWVCQLCGNKFSKKAYLQAHVSAHGIVKPFACPRCHKTFASNKMLKVHMITSKCLLKKINDNIVIASAAV